MVLHALSFGLVSALSSSALAATVSTTLNIVNGEVNLDGYSKVASLANGTFPGPIISINKGDRLEVNVTNGLTESNGLDLVTTVHWHGIDQLQSNWADGVASVTQCPIVPGNSFLYNFTIPNQAGTFFYHSHYGGQMCDGLKGALIVRDPNDPLKYLYDVDDDSTVISISDWYHFASHNVAKIPEFDSVVINGIGRYVNGPTDNALAVVNVKAGTRRVPRIFGLPNFVFSIDKHTLTVIEADGNSVIPHDVSSLQIFAGQRYSVVLDADQPKDNYWIRAAPNSHTNNSTGNGLNSAILNYEGVDVADPSSADTASSNRLAETDLHPLDVSVVPEADMVIDIDWDFNTTSGLFTANNVSFAMQYSMPVLLQILSGNQKAEDLLPSGSVYSLPRNQTIELRMPARPGTIAKSGPHPYHLHGHSFWVIQSAGNNTQNTIDPVMRDVVAGTTDANDVSSELRIRFRTDNPGPWIFHCHIDWHMATGFAIVFAEDTSNVPDEVTPPSEWDQLCPAYNSFIERTK
ncbi:multicopper oxidase [Peniophora sp. CONT]|nr:multicopper oxidase [Peniophora sp. CONT]